MSMTPSSHQATGRLAAPRDDRYPFRVVINELTKRGWTHTGVYEAPDEETAHEGALEYCESIEFSEEGVQAVHYYVGEVA